MLVEVFTLAQNFLNSLTTIKSQKGLNNTFYTLNLSSEISPCKLESSIQIKNLDRDIYGREKNYAINENRALSNIDGIYLCQLI